MATLFNSKGATIDQLLSAWKANGGPTDQEVIDFAAAASTQLNDSEMVAKFEENVREVGTRANAIDRSFDRVVRAFQDMVNRYGSDYPGFSAYLTEWRGYNQVWFYSFFFVIHNSCLQRWIENLALSRDVASEQVTVLRRMDCPFRHWISLLK